MKFTELPLKNCYVVDIEPIEDERGFFARAWSRKEFEALGFNADFNQHSVSYNRKKGTLRGMHFQVDPFEETKIVQCIRGAIFDVIVDVRPNSPTYGQWASVNLTVANRKMLYIPPGFAHGFQTLEDDSEVFYQITAEYSPAHARGYRYNDPAFGIHWPLSVSLVSERDQLLPAFKQLSLSVQE